MMARHKNVIHLSEVPSEQMKAPEESFFGAERQRVGAAIGAKKLGYSLFTVPPGKAAFPFHLHYTNEEMIYIIEGEAILRLGNQEMSVSAGTFFACPPGAEHPHQLINASKNNLRYLVVSTMEYPDISEYPDSNKIGAYVTSASEGGFRALYRKDSNVSYFEGESGSEIERIKRAKR
jgi:uncharacterized cupin superfamily protein